MWTALFLVFNSVPLLKAAFVRCGNNTYPARGDIISNEDTSGLFFPIFRAFPNFWEQKMLWKSSDLVKTD